jgi:hypothetical protein
MSNSVAAESEGIDWDHALWQHYDAAECEACHKWVEQDVTGRFYPVGSGAWAIWYHDACRPKPTSKLAPTSK